eukprot:9463889-Pyramimonas_sp.AAC.1
MDVCVIAAYYSPQPVLRVQRGVYFRTVMEVTKWIRCILDSLAVRCTSLFYTDVNDGMETVYRDQQRIDIESESIGNGNSDYKEAVVNIFVNCWGYITCGRPTRVEER